MLKFWNRILSSRIQPDEQLKTRVTVTEDDWIAVGNDMRKVMGLPMYSKSTSKPRKKKR